MVFRDESAPRRGAGPQVGAYRRGEAANVADIAKAAALLPGQETQVHADAGYPGVEKRPEIVALGRKRDWPIAGKRGRIKAMAEGAEKEALKAVENGGE